MSIMKKTIYQRAVETFGVQNQFDLAQEECAELIVAISHNRRKRTNFDHIAEEVADVGIMAKQLRLIVGPKIVDRIRREKLKRLEGRIAAHLATHGRTGR